MEINIFAIFQSIGKAVSESDFFRGLKIFSAFAITILLIADILLLAKRFQGDVKVAVYGAKVPALKKSKYTERWETIKKHLSGDDLHLAKIAVIEADQMLGETLEKIGYAGTDTAEKIAAVRPGQLIGIEEAKDSHEIFKKIVRDSGFEISLEDIRRALDGYEKVFRGLELLD